jgi:hypothetical protein
MAPWWSAQALQRREGRDRAFRWTASGGMEDLNTTYASLLTDGSVLRCATPSLPMGAILWDGVQRCHRAQRSLPAGYAASRRNGDVDNNGCIDDADLLAVLFAFGNSGNNLGREDTNCDGVVDDADLLIVLFNFGSGC